MVCDKCEGKSLSIEDLNDKHNLGMFTKPIVITCSECGNKKAFSREEWYNLRQGLVEEVYVEIKEE